MRSIIWHGSSFRAFRDVYGHTDTAPQSAKVDRLQAIKAGHQELLRGLAYTYMLVELEAETWGNWKYLEYRGSRLRPLPESVTNSYI